MTTDATVPTGESVPFPVGTLLGRCRLQKIIGQGGMGTVYLAHHESLDKTVAVKVLPRKYSVNTDYVRRFQREARSAAKLEHPNIIQVLDVTNDGDVHYIVMQYYEGMDLARLMDKKGRVSVSDALSIVKKVAQALAAAHKAGIVHRDIKPSNIVITKQGKVLVTDFGLAREMHGTVTGNAITQSSGIVLGTPQYISPEQAMGERSESRSDIYSLGATMYAMLAGRPPYDDDNPVSVLMKHVRDNERPVPLRKLNPDVPEAAEKLVERMMGKRPADRPASMDEIVEAIDTIKAGRGTGTVGMTKVKRRPTWLLALGGGMVVGMVVMIAVLVALVMSSARKDLEAAVRAEQLAGADTGKLRDVLQMYRDVESKYPKSEQGKEAKRRATELEVRIRGITTLARIEEVTEQYRRKQMLFPAAYRELARRRERPNPPEVLQRLEAAIEGLSRDEVLARAAVLGECLQFREPTRLREIVEPSRIGVLSDPKWLSILLALWMPGPVPDGVRISSAESLRDTCSVNPAAGRGAVTLKATVGGGGSAEREATFNVAWKLLNEGWYLVVDDKK